MDIFSNTELFSQLAVGVAHPITAGEDVLRDLVLVAALETWHREETRAGEAAWQRMCCSAAFHPENTKRQCKGQAIPAFPPSLALNQANSAGTTGCSQRGCRCVGHSSFGHFPWFWVLLNLGLASGSARQGSASWRWETKGATVPKSQGPCGLGAGMCLPQWHSPAAPPVPALRCVLQRTFRVLS